MLFLKDLYFNSSFAFCLILKFFGSQFDTFMDPASFFLYQPESKLATVCLEACLPTFQNNWAQIKVETNLQFMAVEGLITPQIWLENI